MTNQNTPEGKTRADAMIELLSSLLKFKVDIERALCYSSHSHTFDDIVDMVVTGAAHFYPLANSFLIMELQVYPQHKVYNTFLAGGVLHEILETESWMRDNAEALGCKHVTMMGRKGWEPVLKAKGWKHKYTVMYKEVEKT